MIEQISCCETKYNKCTKHMHTNQSLKHSRSLPNGLDSNRYATDICTEEQAYKAEVPLVTLAVAQHSYTWAGSTTQGKILDLSLQQQHD